MKDIEKILSEIKQDAAEFLSKEEFRIKYLGKKGVINELTKDIKNIVKEKRGEFGKKINEVKKIAEEELDNIKDKIEDFKSNLEDNVNQDLTKETNTKRLGNYHPITIVEKELLDFFKYYGFSTYQGPEIEDDYHNFEMLGVPKDHPARELQDSLYIKSPEILLRTQTSSIESRLLEEKEPPIRTVFAGKAFRNETASKSNSSMFHQFQGVCVGENIHLGHLKWAFTKSLQHIFDNNVKIRFRSKYYPEVEPGMSPDIQCKFCNGVGCDICKYRGWIEIAGGGMIHPRTLKAAGIDPKKYSGFAFGWGLDRVAMSKFNIKDIRYLYNGTLNYK